MELGRKMLGHCNGHPLAIAVLGGVLATKKTVEEWQSVYDNLSSHLQGDESYTGVYEVLAMSYYELPYHLKPCFLILGNFPEDYEISVEKLYDLWIAEGIVSLALDKVATKSSLDDICQIFLNELVQKSMVQVGSRDVYGKIATCQLHDLMRDKCLEINREENFIQTFDYNAREGQQKPNQKPRRMAIYTDYGKFSDAVPKSTSQKSPLRSILFFSSDEHSDVSPDFKGIKSLFKDFNLLRVLDFEGVELYGCLPKEVGRLIFLRYLSLKGTFIGELPSSIKNLKSLMILDLRARSVFKIPNLVWQMKSLTHLYFPDFFGFDLYVVYGDEIKKRKMLKLSKGKMLKLSQLSQLEKLENVVLDVVDVDGLAELAGSIKNLKAICESKDKLVPFLRSKSIKSLALRTVANMIKEDPMILSACDALKDLGILGERDKEQSALPMTLGMFPQNLVKLSFGRCKFLGDPMPILETLLKLKTLGLFYCHDVNELACSEEGFPELTELSLGNLSSLRNWTVKNGGLPKLQKVRVLDCPIRMLPDSLPSQVSIECLPCVRGIERYGTCPHLSHFKGVFQDDDDDDDIDNCDGDYSVVEAGDQDKVDN